MSASIHSIKRFGRYPAVALASFVFLSAWRCAVQDRPDFAPPGPESGDLRSDPFLDTLQVKTFGFFWDLTDHETGLTPDRAPGLIFSSIAAVGFALPAYAIGAERGYVERSEAAQRTLNTLRYFWELPQGTDSVSVSGHRGFFYHFLHFENGLRYRNTELSTIDTALLIAGVLFAQEYFDDADSTETAIRAYADSLYLRIEWDWFRHEPPLLTMGWYPEKGRGFNGSVWRGYNEGMILYILGLGSPTHPIEPEAWDAWTSTYEWSDFYGYEHVNFTPLFGHQYSQAFIDFRGIQDAYMREVGIDYFENSVRATLSQKAYAQDNPGGWKDYGGDIWGLTACDGPGAVVEMDGDEQRFHAYWARGASDRQINDDGTIAPTAVGGSIPFAPVETIAALKAMKQRYGEPLFSTYGFLDSFNPTFTFVDAEMRHGQVVDGLGWFDTDYLGIDQGPIIIMAENYRTGLVWETMKKNKYIVRGLERAGFTGGWLEELGIRN
ncbi:MAG TPA: glucoamylase family protein [Rhodothermia bacterium]|nr:glucoamylase family protein [Rhodothermia bacterium]